ncbi:MAG: arsenate reductase ArsC [Chloroflexota bacterium]
MRKTKVLFLCTANTARSQMAEALLKHYGGDRFEAHSAGFEPRDIHPYTVQVMEELGLGLEGQYAKSVMEYMGRVHFGCIVTVCDVAEKKCPTVFPDITNHLHWSFKDPVAFVGTEAEKLDQFRQVRDQIDQRLREWLAGQGIVAAPLPR